MLKKLENGNSICISCIRHKSVEIVCGAWWTEHTFTNSIVLSPARFIQMAPQYYFYNLPPSESKDILQNILNHGASQHQEKPPTSQEEPREDQTYDRCVIQWLTPLFPVMVRTEPVGLFALYCTEAHCLDSDNLISFHLCPSSLIFATVSCAVFIFQ